MRLLDYHNESVFVGAGLRARPVGVPPNHPVRKEGGHGDPPLRNGALLIIECAMVADFSPGNRYRGGAVAANRSPRLPTLVRSGLSSRRGRWGGARGCAREGLRGALRRETWRTWEPDPG